MVPITAKFCYDLFSSFNIWRVWLENLTPIHTLKTGVLGLFDPLSGLQYQRKLKKALPQLGTKCIKQKAVDSVISYPLH